MGWWEWIGTWTLFNWLALIGFLFGCVSVTNAFFGLKSRFKDWFTLTSKQALRKRLLELEKIAQNTKRHINEPATLLIDLLWETTSHSIVFCIIFIIDVFIVSILIIRANASKFLTNTRVHLFSKFKILWLIMILLRFL